MCRGVTGEVVWYREREDTREGSRRLQMYAGIIHDSEGISLYTTFANASGHSLVCLFIPILLLDSAPNLHEGALPLQHLS